MSIGGATLVRGNGSGQINSPAAHDLDPGAQHAQDPTYDAMVALTFGKRISQARVPVVASTCGLVRL